jgi:outer membrane protein assembly factor BamE (lipoprotein component of BamABCDE complex)
VYNRIGDEFHCFGEENGLRGEFQSLKLIFYTESYYERRDTKAFIARLGSFFVEKKKIRSFFSCLLALMVFVGATIIGVLGCSAEYHAGEVNKGLQGNKMTVGTVQREIKLGMTSVSVVEALGAPNIVTTDEQRREVWVYDKIATDVAASKGYWTLILLGQESGAASKSQRTLTIIIKFDEDKKVRDFAYHTSRF